MTERLIHYREVLRKMLKARDDGRPDSETDEMLADLDEIFDGFTPEESDWLRANKAWLRAPES